MLGRGVAGRLAAHPRAPLVSAPVIRRIAEADTFVLNLECCIAERGAPFPEPGKPFFFRAPPAAAMRLAELGVDAVTLANNHALDYGAEALLETLERLEAAGIAAVGAGAEEQRARSPVNVDCGSLRLRLIALSDHPASYAAGADRPGIAYAELQRGLPEWVAAAVRPAADADLVVVLPHWGPNMVEAPVEHVRRAATALLAAGANLVAGHSAHVFQGVAPPVIYDLGDFIDDYAVHPCLRNDLGLLWLVELDAEGMRSVRALPLVLDYCFTRHASPEEARQIAELLRRRCAGFDTAVRLEGEMIKLGVGRGQGSE